MKELYRYEVISNKSNYKKYENKNLKIILKYPHAFSRFYLQGKYHILKNKFICI